MNIQKWKEANQVGLVPIFELDGSVSRFEKNQADIEWQVRDNQYEQQVCRTISRNLSS